MTKSSGAAVQAGWGTAFYAEDHCALNWRFLTAGVYGPAAGIALVVAALTSGLR